MRVVLDKSALFGLRSERIRALCAEHDVWMPEVLFYELLTCDAEQRARLFRKLHAMENPLSLIANGGFLFGRELEFGRPTEIIKDSALNGVRWIFNKKLGDPKWIPTDSLSDISDWHASMAIQVADFRERASLTAHAFFPDLRDVRGGERQRVEPFQRELGGNSDIVRYIYTQLAESNGQTPPPDLGPQWMGFTLLQAQLIWGLDHISRYGAGNFDCQVASIENTFCDTEYAAIASHADALLTNDGQLAELFALMAPHVYCGRDLPIS